MQEPQRLEKKCVSFEYGWNAFHTIAFPAEDGSLRALSTASKNKLYIESRTIWTINRFAVQQLSSIVGFDSIRRHFSRCSAAPRGASSAEDIVGVVKPEADNK
jgi:hypothetical protein